MLLEHLVNDKMVNCEHWPYQSLKPMIRRRPLQVIKMYPLIDDLFASVLKKFILN